MKEKYELIGYGNSAHLIRKYKKHWWNKWQIEMDGATPKIYPVDQEQLYIRFGEIPTNEKSKIYQGEIEVGTENGVSVYPAFKTDEGDIVLGLNLPITKTTLYTQQHLIEYDDRPCYLVKGDYIGKDTDGQPLINNVSIVERINSYRVKEEKQCEQKPTDKVEPKFHECDWVVHQGTENIYQVVAVIDNQYQLKYGDNYTVQKCADVDRCVRLWNITKDAKGGDVLCDYSEAYDNPLIFILKKFECVNFGLVRPSDYSSYCFLTAGDIQRFKEGTYHHKHNIEPATKEQRDLLFTKMKEAGYEWDAEKKELKKIEQKPTWSEEDEKLYTWCASAIQTRYNDGLFTMDEYRETSLWLKSLKERMKEESK